MQGQQSLYEFKHPVNDEQILEAAAYIIAKKQFRDGVLNSPNDCEEYLKHKLAIHEHEVFAVLFLDSQNRILDLKSYLEALLTQLVFTLEKSLKRCWSLMLRPLYWRITTLRALLRPLKQTGLLLPNYSKR